MRPLPISRALRQGLHAHNVSFHSTAIRRSSITTPLETLESSLREQLTSRPPNIIFDYLSPTPSHLLNITLSDILPQECWPHPFTTSKFASGRNITSRLPQGHHLVYFNPQVRSSGLLPDGTDHLQSPDGPFTRRMWAGGRIYFDTEPKVQMRTGAKRACCTEVISDVQVKGVEGNEKVFVTIQRQIGDWQKRFPRPVFQMQNPDIVYPVTVVEERNIVYFRKNAHTEGELPKTDKILKPTFEPDFSFKFTPTRTLLFRFSALTFNAHAIHLDPQYCREVEGHRNLLVHGPLSLVLMLSALTSQLNPAKNGRPKELIRSFQYRNLAPLYVDEEMRICVRKDPLKEDKYDVWIEGKDGGYAVKGSALVHQWPPLQT